MKLKLSRHKKAMEVEVGKLQSRIDDRVKDVLKNQQE